MIGTISVFLHGLIFVIALYIIIGLFIGTSILANSFFTPLAFFIMIGWLFFEIMLLKV